MPAGRRTGGEGGRYGIATFRESGQSVADTLQLGMLMFVTSNLLGSTIQITTLPLPVLSTLQAVRLILFFPARVVNALLRLHSPVSSSIPYAPP